MRRRASCRGDGQRPQLAGPDMADRRGHGGEADLDLPAQQIDHGRSVAAIMHCHQVDAGHDLEQLAGHVARCPDAGGSETRFAGIGLGVSDEFGDRIDRQRWRDFQHVGHANEAGDRRGVVEEIEIELVVEAHIDGGRGGDHAQRVTIGRRVDEGLMRNIAAGARAVVDDEGLSEPFRQPLPDQAPQRVGGAARRETDQEAYRSRRIGVRPRDPR